jgi:hypothetical protein
VISREQVVAGASRLFVCAGPVDMKRLAVAPSVRRATLYRIVGVPAKAVEAATCVFIEAARPADPSRGWPAIWISLASLYLRIFESMYYGELPHRCVPDADRVEHAARALPRPRGRSPGRRPETAVSPSPVPYPRSDGSPALSSSGREFVRSATTPRPARLSACCFPGRRPLQLTDAS